MAQPKEPLDDVLRVADLMDQAVVLLSRGVNPSEIITGLAVRLRTDVGLERAGEKVPGGV